MVLVLTPLLVGLSFLSGMLGLSETLSRIFAVAFVAFAAQRAWILVA